MQLDSAAQDMLQLDGSASQLFSQVWPSPQASLFPDLAELSSPLQARIAQENKAARVIEFQRFMGVSVGKVEARQNSQTGHLVGADCEARPLSCGARYGRPTNGKQLQSTIQR